MDQITSQQPGQVQPGQTALLIIDVQQGLFNKSTPIYKAEALLRNLMSLIDRAHGSGVPVFYMQHSDPKYLVKGSSDWQLHPRLQPLKADYRIHKQHGNAFEETSLQEILQSLKVTSLVIAGLVTHGCVKSTCLGALQLGYDVTLVKDGHSSYSKQAAEKIEEWNQKLHAQNAVLKAALEIDF